MCIFMFCFLQFCLHLAPLEKIKTSCKSALRVSTCYRPLSRRLRCGYITMHQVAVVQPVDFTLSRRRALTLARISPCAERRQHPPAVLTSSSSAVVVLSPGL